MSDYSRLSIWENDPDTMSWYDHAVGRTTPSKPFITPNARVSTFTDVRPEITQGNHEKELSYQNRWFQTLKAEDRKQANRSRVRPKAILTSTSKPTATNKKPDAPKRDPYFEYLFSDAELERSSRNSGNSIDNLSHGKLSDTENMSVDQVSHKHRRYNPTPPNRSPLYPPRSPSIASEHCSVKSPTPNQVLCDSAVAMPRRLLANPPASPSLYDPRSPDRSPWSSTPSTPTASLINSPACDVDHEPASSDECVLTPDVESRPTSPMVLSDSSPVEYGLGIAGIPVTDKSHAENGLVIASARSSYSQYVDETPLLSNENAITDLFPSYMLQYSPVPFEAPTIVAKDTVAPLTVSHAYAPWQPRQRPKIKPKSQKAKLERQQNRIDSYFAFTSTESVTSRRVRSPSIEIIKVVKKRTAADSFGDHHIRDQDADVEYIRNKKARTFLDETNDDVQTINALPVADAVSLSDTASSRRLSQDFFNHKPLAVAPKGYAGQFDGITVNRKIYEGFKYDLSYLGPDGSGTQHTFGSRAHPNGTFTHNSITFDTLLWTKDYTNQVLPSGHPLKRCMEHATDMTILASQFAAVTLRNKDEEILRREAHIECANARLEGVSIGYLRYYQGHLNLEEYHEAGMCICWDLCSCSKMCSRFADLKCPCSKHIIIHSD